MARMQQGSIELRGTTWLFRYRERVLVDGQVVSKPKTKKLATMGDKYPDEESVRPLANLLLAPILTNTAPAESRHTLTTFVEQVFLPDAAARLKPSTAQTYKTIWKLFSQHTNGTEMRRYRTSDIDKMLTAVGARGFSHNTNKKCKAFLSAVFREGRRRDFCSVDPVRDARLPRGKAHTVTSAYSLDEVVAMLKVLGEPSRTAVIVAALTGLRLSEIKGLKWSDYSGETLNISRSVWSGKISDTKTLTSAAPVPVVKPVAEALTAQRKRVPSNVPWIFPGEKCGRPLRLENETRRVIVPTLNKAAIAWRGWHGFRRGVGSVLNSLGIDPKTTQQILRHANVSTTTTYYIKPVDKAAKSAMGRLSRAFEKKMK